MHIRLLKQIAICRGEQSEEKEHTVNDHLGVNHKLWEKYE